MFCGIYFIFSRRPHRHHLLLSDDATLQRLVVAIQWHPVGFPYIWLCTLAFPIIGVREEKEKEMWKSEMKYCCLWEWTKITRYHSNNPARAMNVTVSVRMCLFLSLCVCFSNWNSVRVEFSLSFSHLSNVDAFRMYSRRVSVRHCACHSILTNGQMKNTRPTGGTVQMKFTFVVSLRLSGKSNTPNTGCAAWPLCVGTPGARVKRCSAHTHTTRNGIFNGIPPRGWLVL